MMLICKFCNCKVMRSGKGSLVKREVGVVNTESQCVVIIMGNCIWALIKFSCINFNGQIRRTYALRKLYNQIAKHVASYPSSFDICKQN